MHVQCQDTILNYSIHYTYCKASGYDFTILMNWISSTVAFLQRNHNQESSYPAASDNNDFNTHTSSAKEAGDALSELG